MYLLADTGRRLWRRIMRRGPTRSPGCRRPASVVVSVLAVIGVTAGTVLVTACGTPTGSTPTGTATAATAATATAATATAGKNPAQASLPTASPARSRQTEAVVPLLGGNVDGSGTPVPVASTSAVASTEKARSAPVAPLRGLRQADLLVVAPFSLSAKVLATVSRQPAVTGAEPLEAAKIKINGTFTAVLGVNPSTFRSYADKSIASSNQLWQGVADGGVAVSYTMGTLDRLALGGKVTALGRTQQQLPVVAFGTVGIGGVNAVMSDTTARSLGVPASNAIVISASPASVPALTARIKKLLPSGAGIEPLVTLVSGTSSAGTAPGIVASGGDAMTAAELTGALRAAESRRGLPYVWGAAGPSSFDCSGLVQWAFAQAGVAMPRVAADQARTGAAVPVGQLQPGDLLFYHTDPTDPGYISHVAIYLGNGWMIQAPQPGMDVEIVPASFGSEFAGAIRVYPRIAATLAGSPV
jgi:cell wall-associated NlpC family hydrolase